MCYLYYVLFYLCHDVTTVDLSITDTAVLGELGLAVLIREVSWLITEAVTQTGSVFGTEKDCQ